MARYNLDGIFITAGTVRMCYASIAGQISKPAAVSNCRALAIPVEPARRAYILWRQQRLFDLWQFWDAEVPKLIHKPALSPYGRRGDGVRWNEKGSAKWRTRYSPIGRPGAIGAPWSNGKMGRSSRYSGSKPIVGIFRRRAGRTIKMERFRSKAKRKTRMLVADGLPMPAAMVYQISAPYTRALAQVVEDIYGRHYLWKNICATKRQSLGSPCYIPSKPPGFMAKTAFREKIEDPPLAVSGVIEARVPF